MTRNRRVPPPSPKILAKLLEQLPAHILEAVVSRAEFTCLLRELTELDHAITANDLVQRSLPPHGTGQEPRIAVEARRREDRAFRRVGLVAGALLEAKPTDLNSAIRCLLVIIAAGQPGSSDADSFPWHALRQLLAALTEL